MNTTPTILYTGVASLVNIKLPEGSHSFEIDDRNYFPQIALVYRVGDRAIYDIPLTDGDNSEKMSFEILGRSGEITEEQAISIVKIPELINYEPRYFLYNRERDYLAITALDSYHSFASLHKIDNNDLIILKK